MTRSFQNLCIVVFGDLVLLLLQVPIAHGQTFRGTFLGTVTDSSGAAIAGATVNIKNLDTGLTRTVNTSAHGSYAVPELPIGNYRVTGTKKITKSLYWHLCNRELYSPYSTHLSTSATSPRRR